MLSRIWLDSSSGDMCEQNIIKGIALKIPFLLSGKENKPMFPSQVEFIRDSRPRLARAHVARLVKYIQ